MRRALYSFAEEIGRRLLEKRHRLVTAESYKSGWVAKCVTNVAGSSQWFDRGFMTYLNEAKIELLGVSDSDLTRYGAVSRETVQHRGVAIFAKACFEHPSSSKRQKLNATVIAFGAPLRPAAFACDPARGRNLRHSDLTPCRMALHFSSVYSGKTPGPSAIGDYRPSRSLSMADSEGLRAVTTIEGDLLSARGRWTATENLHVTLVFLGNVAVLLISSIESAVSQIDVRAFEVRRDELDWPAMDAETRAEFEKLFDGNERLTIDPSALERRFTIPERNRAIVREFRQVLDNGYRDHKGKLRKPLIGKTIVFAVNKRHAETLAGMFDEAFRDRKNSPEVRYADYVVSGMGQDDTLDGMSKIRHFKKEPFPKILVSVNMLDTGFTPC